MSFDVEKTELTELDAAAVRSSYPHLFMQARRKVIKNVPSDQKVAIIAIALGPAVEEGDQAAIEAGIEALHPGIQKARVQFYGQAPSDADTPDGKELVLNVEAGFDYVQIPIPEPE